jgi:hypothetical protein
LAAVGVEDEVGGEVKAVFSLLVLIAAIQTARADSWMFRSPVEYERFVLGDIHCVVTTKAKPNIRNVYPAFELVCTKGEKTFFRKPHLGATAIFRSTDGEYLLGASNDGLHRYAAWIITTAGVELKLVKHHSPSIEYCSPSVTVSRTWLASAPLPEFKIENRKLVDVTVAGCNGKRISVLKASEKN